MDRWSTFVATVLERHGVADVRLALEHGIEPSRFYVRTAREGWYSPAPRVRVHPSAGRSVQREVLVAAGATRHLVAASRVTAAWLHGFATRPPERVSVATSRQVHVPHAVRVASHRVRWLSGGDIIAIEGVPTLAVPATFLTLLSDVPDRVWGWLIDAVHRGASTPEDILSRLNEVGPVTGKGQLRRWCEELARTRVESVFQDDVAAELERLGYRPDRSTRRIPTADGRGVVVDVALTDWKVAVEPDGDRFHRTREQRRIDRRRAGAFATSEWVRVPVDWRDWHLDREHILASIDGAIAVQQRRGIGRDRSPPRREPGRP